MKFALTPAVAVVGQQVTFAGTGYTPAEAVSIRISRPGCASSYTVFTALANRQGEIAGAFVVPAICSTVIAQPDRPAGNAGATALIAAQGVSSGRAIQTTLTVPPTRVGITCSGATTVLLTATGFAAGEPVWFHLGLAGATGAGRLITVRADQFGNVHAVLAAPRNLGSSLFAVSGRGQNSTFVADATARLSACSPVSTPTWTPTWTPLPTPTFTPAPPHKPRAVPANTVTALPTGIPTSTPAAIVTATRTPVFTSTPTDTRTAVPTKIRTATPTGTDTPRPTKVSTATPTNTHTAVPTKTETAAPTDTAVPKNTRTATPTGTDTPKPIKTSTATPADTNTPKPTNTSTATPADTDTPIPVSTATPTDTDTAIPTNTGTATPMDTSTPIPTNTGTATPTDTDTPIPTEVSTATPTDTDTAVPTATLMPAPAELPLLQAGVALAWHCDASQCSQQVQIINLGPGPVEGPLTGSFPPGSTLQVAGDSSCLRGNMLHPGHACVFRILASGACVQAPVPDTLTVTANAGNSPLSVPISFDVLCQMPAPPPAPTATAGAPPAPDLLEGTHGAGYYAPPARSFAARWPRR